MQLFYSFVLIVHLSTVSSEEEGDNIKSSIPKKQHSVPIGYPTIPPYKNEHIILKGHSNEREWQLLNKRSADPRGHHHSHGHIHVHTHIHKHKREISSEPRKNLDQRLNEKIHRLTDIERTKTLRKMNDYLKEVKDFVELENNYVDQDTILPEVSMRRRRRSPRIHSHSHSRIHHHKKSDQQNLNQLEENSPTEKNPGPNAKTHHNFEQNATTPASNSRMSDEDHGINRRAIPEDLSTNLDKQQNLIQEEKHPENFSRIITESYGDILDQIMKNVYKYKSTNFIEIEGNQIDQDGNQLSPIEGLKKILGEHSRSHGHIHIHPHGGYKTEISEVQDGISESPNSRRSPKKHTHSHGHNHVHTHGVHKREILMNTNNNMNQDQAGKLIGRRDLNTKIKVHSKIIDAEKGEVNGQFLRSPKVISRRKRDPHSHEHAHFHTFSSFSDEIPDIPQAAIEVEYPKRILKVFGVKRSDHHAHTHAHYHAHSHNIFKREAHVQQVKENSHKNDDNISLDRGVLIS